MTDDSQALGPLVRKIEQGILTTPTGIEIAPDVASEVGQELYNLDDVSTRERAAKEILALALKYSSELGLEVTEHVAAQLCELAAVALADAGQAQALFDKAGLRRAAEAIGRKQSVQPIVATAPQEGQVRAGPGAQFAVTPPKK